MAELKIVNVVGSKANFIKLAPLLAEMKRHSQISPLIVHAGQPDDEAVPENFFRDLDLPPPHIQLQVSPATQARQTSQILQGFEEVLQDVRPDLVLVVGDVNSTLACSLTAVKLGVATAHVEAGLRIFNRETPEEINRVATDAVCDLLFATERSAVENLLREGAFREKVFFAGNVLADALQMYAGKIAASRVLERLSLSPGRYALLTLHRPAGSDDSRILPQIGRAMEMLGHELQIVFPAIPRTISRLDRCGLLKKFRSFDPFLMTDPVSFLDFIRLLKESQFVMTDSGGVQEESTIAGIPCLTLRENTERPATVMEGSNRLVGADPEEILDAAKGILYGKRMAAPVPEKWDGKAAKRIVEVLLQSASQIKQLYLSVREREICGELLSKAS